MEKVIVNKVVAGWIEVGERKVKKHGLQDNKAAILSFATENLCKTDLLDQNIDIVTLAKAIQYGYEVPYEFKIGDIVMFKSSRVLVCLSERLPSNIDNYTLVCKLENREDLVSNERN